MIRRPHDRSGPRAGANWGRTLLVVVACWMVGVTAVSRGANPPVGAHPPPFQYGLSAAMLAGYNENDVTAALSVWAKEVAKEHGVRIDPNIKVLNGLRELRQGLIKKRVDGVAMGIDEYWEVRSLLSHRHYVANYTGGDIYENYLVLVRQDSGITNLTALQGRTLFQFENSEMRLAAPWLDTVLLEHGLPAEQSFFGHVSRLTKLTKVILPVFFQRAPACLVTRKGFDVMVELNPQVGRQLRVLAASPKLIATGFFLRANYPSDLVEAFVKSVEQVNTSAAGRQVLTVFHTDRLVEQPFSTLARTLQLLDTYHRLLGSERAPPAVDVSMSAK